MQECELYLRSEGYPPQVSGTKRAFCYLYCGQCCHSQCCWLWTRRCPVVSAEGQSARRAVTAVSHLCPSAVRDWLLTGPDMRWPQATANLKRKLPGPSKDLRQGTGVLPGGWAGAHTAAGDTSGACGRSCLSVHTPPAATHDQASSTTASKEASCRFSWIVTLEMSLFPPLIGRRRRKIFSWSLI